MHVFFDGTTATGGFMETDIATLSRASAHSIRFLITFKTGADDVKVFVDGKKLISDTTWEDYYRELERAGRVRPARCCSARAAPPAPATEARAS